MPIQTNIYDDGTLLSIKTNSTRQLIYKKRLQVTKKKERNRKF